MKEVDVFTDSVVSGLLSEDVTIRTYWETSTRAAVEVSCGQTVIYSGTNEDSTVDASSFETLGTACDDAACEFFMLGILLMQSSSGFARAADYQRVLEEARDRCVRLVVENAAR